jgi:hypothetical protein
MEAADESCCVIAGEPGADGWPKMLLGELVVDILSDVGSGEAGADIVFCWAARCGGTREEM